MDYTFYFSNRRFHPAHWLLTVVLGCYFSAATTLSVRAQASLPRLATQASPLKPTRLLAAAAKEKKKKKAKLPPEPLSGIRLANAQYNFSSSSLKGVTLENPTSLQFGPDGRLYVSQQNGLIKAFTIRKDAPNNYTVTATETIELRKTRIDALLR